MKRFSDERGAAMAFALAFLSLFGLIVAARLGLADTGLRSAKALNAEGHEASAATGALEGAINRVRPSLAVGIEGYDEVCFAPPALNGITADVRCVGQAGSGTVSGGSSDSGSTPAYALWALTAGTDGEEGIFQKDKKGVLPVAAPIGSRRTIVAEGEINVTGKVDALNTCTGTITSTSPPLRCSNTGGGASSAALADPAYGPAIAAPAADAVLPSCGSGWLVTLNPGTYRDAEALNDLFDDCDDRVFHMKPGTYSFLFSGKNVWKIEEDETVMIAGTPSGWNPSAATRPTIPLPGGCDPSAAGVQMIFGGASRWVVKDARVEVCAPPVVGNQRIAIYGANAASPGFPASSNCLVATPWPDKGCALLDVEGKEAVLAIHGTIYAPLAPIDLELEEDAVFTFDRGIVARTIRVNADKKWSQPGAAFSLPAAAPLVRADRVVRLTARVGGVVRIRALITIDDDNGSTPGKAVTINEWSVS